MCGCSKPKEQNISPIDLQKMQDDKARKYERLVEISKQKISQGIPLGTGDICPFCKKNIWYYCRNACIVTGEKL